MKLKDILKILEKIENNENKINYLKELIKKTDDKDLINEIKELINELEEDLETKLEQNVAVTPARKREIELDEVEHDIETREQQVTRQRPIARPDLNLQNRESEGEVRYETNVSNYQSRQAPVYQVNPSFSTYESVAQHDLTNARIVEKILVEEDILTPGSSISETQKEQLRDTIDRFMPNASTEERLTTEKQIIYDMKLKGEELRYIKKLK